jgi:hypothetical protein
MCSTTQAGAPGEAPFIKAGDLVEEGQVVGMIAMDVIEVSRVGGAGMHSQPDVVKESTAMQVQRAHEVLVARKGQA